MPKADIGGLIYLQVVWGGNDKNLAYASQHEHRNGVVNHGLVVDGKQLLRHSLCDGVQTCATAPGQNNSFHILVVFMDANLSVYTDITKKNNKNCAAGRVFNA